MDVARGSETPLPSLVLPVAWELLPRGERVMVAVSSGADSTALLLALQKAECDVVAGHINHDLHELRAGECDRDEAWLRAVCERRGVALRVEKLELPRKGGHINEAVAREGRYRALGRLAREAGCTRVVTAHTMQDVLETLLLFWLRGATVKGFTGIAPQRALDGGVLLVRPLLGATREETRAYCRGQGQEWREDASNRDPGFLRNRVRHELLPLLSEISGKPVERLARQTGRGCELARDDENYLEAQARQGLWAITLRKEGLLRVLDGAAWLALDPALQRRSLRQAALEAGGTPNSEHIEAVRRHIKDSGRRAVWDWPGDVKCEWTGPGSGNRLRVWGVPRTDSPADGSPRL